MYSRMQTCLLLLFLTSFVYNVTLSLIFELTGHERQSFSVIATIALRFRTEAGQSLRSLLLAFDVPYPSVFKRCECSKTNGD